MLQMLASKTKFDMTSENMTKTKRKLSTETMIMCRRNENNSTITYYGRPNVRRFPVLKARMFKEKCVCVWVGVK